jgi:hypothetical protein
MKRWVVEVQENEEKDLFIELPEELISEVNWTVGDTIRWIDKEDGTWVIEKVEEIKNE